MDYPPQGIRGSNFKRFSTKSCVFGFFAFLVFPLVIMLTAPLARAAAVTLEPLTTNTLTNSWTLTGASCLTAAGGAKSCSATAVNYTDLDNEGWLRLTSATPSQSGVAILLNPLSFTEGVEVTFTYAMYGGKTALPSDGMSVFLLDPTVYNGSSGLVGGGLGYCGITGGIIGVGLDEAGNFAATNDKCKPSGVWTAISASGPVKSNISIRAGALATPPFEYLAGTGQIPTASLRTDSGWVAPATGLCSDASCQRTGKTIRVRFYPDSTCGTNQLRVQVQSLSDTTIDVSECIALASLGPLPETVELAFAGGTGANDGYHEIRGLSFATIDAVVPDLVPSFSGLTNLAVNTPANVTLTVSNAHAQASADGQVDVALPTGIDLVSPPTGCTATGSPATGFSCDLPAIAASDKTTFVFQINAPAAISDANITAVVSDVTDEVDTANNTANLLVSAPGNPDLVSAITGPSNLTVGGSGTYDVTVTNQGTLPSDDGTVTITPPAGTKLDTTSLPSNCTASGAVLTCTLAGIAQGGSATIPLKLTATRALTNQPITVQVTGVTGEQVTDNNDSQETLTTASASAGTQAVPTLGEVALTLLALLLLCASAVAAKRRGR
jgi:hypothetical protein